jgi:hypothetical protein
VTTSYCCGVVVPPIRPEVLGRPLDDVARVYGLALWVVDDEWPRRPPDAADVAHGVLMAVRWLDGTTDLGFDPSIPCPPRSRADVERQADAAWRLLRWIGIRDKAATATTFAIWDMLAFALGRSGRSPIEKVLAPPRAA